MLTLGAGRFRQAVLFGGEDAAAQPTAAAWALPLSRIRGAAPDGGGGGGERGGEVAVSSVRELGEGGGGVQLKPIDPTAVDAAALSWERLRPSGEAPAARRAHGAARWGASRMIVHGGVGAGGAILGDLHALILRRPVSATSADADDELRWSWVALHAEGKAPAPRAHHALGACDAKMLFLYGGELRGGATSSELWARVDLGAAVGAAVPPAAAPAAPPAPPPADGAAPPPRAPPKPGPRAKLVWTPITASGDAPPPLTRADLVPTHGRLVLVGGCGVGGHAASGALLSHYSRRTHVLDVHALTWTRLHGEAPPRPLAAAADDAAAAAEAPAADGSVAPPPQREQAGVAAIPLASCGSEAVLVFGGCAPLEGGGMTASLSDVALLPARSRRWLKAQAAPLHATPPAARRGHRLATIGSGAVLVYGGVVDVPPPPLPQGDVVDPLAAPPPRRTMGGCALLTAPAVRVVGVSPERVRVGGGDVVLIHGDRFEPTGEIRVRFTALLAVDADFEHAEASRGAPAAPGGAGGGSADALQLRAQSSVPARSRRDGVGDRAHSTLPGGGRWASASAAALGGGGRRRRPSRPTAGGASLAGRSASQA